MKKIVILVCFCFGIISLTFSETGLAIQVAHYASKNSFSDRTIFGGVVIPGATISSSSPAVRADIYSPLGKSSLRLLAGVTYSPISEFKLENDQTTETISASSSYVLDIPLGLGFVIGQGKPFAIILGGSLNCTTLTLYSKSSSSLAILAGLGAGVQGAARIKLSNSFGLIGTASYHKNFAAPIISSVGVDLKDYWTDSSSFSIGAGIVLLSK